MGLVNYERFIRATLHISRDQLYVSGAHWNCARTELSFLFCKQGEKNQREHPSELHLAISMKSNLARDS